MTAVLAIDQWPDNTCSECGVPRALPLFFVQEGARYFVRCHWCVFSIVGYKARERGPWEVQLSGDTWVIMVRP